jgi:hypothetical protein
MLDNTPEDDASVGQPRLSEEEVRAKEAAFPFSKFSRDTLFYDRRTGLERRDSPETQARAPSSVATPPAERRVKKERRRRIDPTTFEKQYTDDEMEFMNAMQRFKVQAGVSFPSHGDVLRIARGLGYRKVQPLEDDPDLFPSDQDEPANDCA